MRKTDRRDIPMSSHEAAVVKEYDDWHAYWMRATSAGALHNGLFDPGCAPDELDVPPGEKAERGAAGAHRMTDAVTAPAAIGADDRVVDAGCGFGAAAVHLAGKHGCKVTGVNINRRQLEVARAKAAEAGLRNRVDFRYADCSRCLPFADVSIDVVVNMESACYYSDRPRFLGEVARILKPGGRFVTEDFMTPDEVTAESFRNHIEPFCRVWKLHSLESRASYTQKLEAAGFQVIEFAGFDGADDFNLRMLEQGHIEMTRALFAGSQPPEMRELHRRFGILAQAWREGHVFLRRFLAHKP